MSDAHKTLIGAVTEALGDLGLQVTSSDSEMTITGPRLDDSSFVFDYRERYLAWERLEHDYWHFDHLTDEQTPEFIAGKIREVLGERIRLAGEFEAWVELARREELSARVMSGELDDVSLYVRRP